MNLFPEKSKKNMIFRVNIIQTAEKKIMIMIFSKANYISCFAISWRCLWCNGYRRMK